MKTETLDIPALAAEFSAAHPSLDPRRQRLALLTLRLLSEGRPVALEELARRANLSTEEVAAFLDEWPIVQRDSHGRVIAYGGLTLEPTSHVLEVDGRTLHTWCALDTLFLPELLGQPARIRSTAPETGEVISLTVDGSGVRDVAPEGAAMTLHAVGGFDLKDVVGTFCCYVHFFASEQVAHGWAERTEGTYVVSIAQGFEYGRLFNHAQLGAALEDR